MFVFGYGGEGVGGGGDFCVQGRWMKLGTTRGRFFAMRTSIYIYI